MVSRGRVRPARHNSPQRCRQRRLLPLGPLPASRPPQDPPARPRPFPRRSRAARPQAALEAPRRHHQGPPRRPGSVAPRPRPGPRQDLRERGRRGKRNVTKCSDRKSTWRKFGSSRVEEKRASLGRSVNLFWGYSNCFRVCWCLSPLLHSYVSSPRPSNRTCGFPASRLSSGIMPFAHGRLLAHRPGGCGAATGKAARSLPTPRLFPLSRPAGPRLPSLPHAARSGVPGHLAEILGSRHSPRLFPPSFAFPGPRPLRSAGVTRPLRCSLLPARSLSTTSLSATLPAQAGPRGFPVGACAPPAGLPCCHRFPLTRMLPSLPRRWNRPVLASLASRPLATFPEFQAGRLPHQSFRGLLNVHCSLLPARSLSRPRRPFDIEVLQLMSLPP